MDCNAMLPDNEMINIWWNRMIDEEIDQIKGTINNERLAEKSYSGDELNPHTQNIVTLVEYLSLLESSKK